MTPSCAQTSATTPPCLSRWATPREPTRAAKTSAWAGRSTTPSTAQQPRRCQRTPAGQATTSTTTRMRVTKVTRKKNRCTTMTEQITKEEGNHVTKEGSSAARLHGRQFLFLFFFFFVSMGCCTGFPSGSHLVFFKNFWMKCLFLTPVCANGKHIMNCISVI